MSSGSGGRRGGPVVALTPDSLHSDLQQGATETQSLTLSNLGDGSLDWSVSQTPLAGLQRAGATDLEPGEDFPRSAVIDPAGAFAYFGTFTAPAKIVKVDLATFRRTGSITLATGQNRLTAAAIDPAGEFAYFGTTTMPGQVVKIDLATLDLVGTVTLDDGEGPLVAAVIDPDGAFAYFAVSSTPGAIVKIDLSTFTRVGAVAFDAADGAPLSGVIDPAGTFAYFGTDSAPGQVVKIDLDAFTRRRRGDDGRWRGCAGDRRDGPGRRVRVLRHERRRRRGPRRESRSGDVRALRRRGSRGRRIRFAVAVIDATGAFAYFGTSASPAQVVKIDVAAMQRVGRATLEGNEYLLRTALIDPAGAFAYFGSTYPAPPPTTKIVKISLDGVDCALPAWAGIDPTSGSVAAGESQPIGVTFDATGQSAGDHAATLCLASNDPLMPLVAVPLSLSVAGGATTPALSFSPPSVDLGDVQLGDTSTPQNATLHNTGNGDATALAFGDLSGTGFAADTSACGSVLPAGESCVVSVTFTPTALGAAAASLTVASTEGASATLDLAGNGIPTVPPPVIEIDPPSLAATLQAGATSTQNITIANSGEETLDWAVTQDSGFRRVGGISPMHSEDTASA